MSRKRVPRLVLLALLACGLPAVAEPPSTDKSDPWLGVFLGDAVDGGVELVALVSGGPAARAGLRKGDIVIRAGELYLSGVQDLEGVLETLRPGDSIELQLLRAGAPVERVVKLSARPGVAWQARPPPPAPDIPERPAQPAPPAPSRPVGPGLKLTDVTPDLREHFGAPEDAGVLVTGVTRELPADRAGIRVGDVIVRVGDVDVRAVVDLDRLLKTEPETDGETTVSLVRGGQLHVVDLAVPAASTAAGRYRAAVERALALAEERNPPAREMLVRSLELEIRRLEQRIEDLRREVEALRENR